MELRIGGLENNLGKETRLIYKQIREERKIKDIEFKIGIVREIEKFMKGKRLR